MKQLFNFLVVTSVLVGQAQVKGDFTFTRDSLWLQQAFQLKDAPTLNLKHTAFHLGYDSLHRQAQWVAYYLTPKRLIRAAERSDKFVPDPKVSNHPVRSSDYTNSGYDRGHLAPAADMSWSMQAMKESFYLTNVSPQVPSFNRGIWKRLEEQVRSWAKEANAILVVTGPLLHDSLPQMGTSRISIPASYYKALVKFTDSSACGIAFILPNAASSEPFETFVVTIDALESQLKLDFFPFLDDTLESELEQTVEASCWRLNETANIAPKVGEDGATPEMLRCGAPTKSGGQCKNKVSTSGARCHLHSTK